MAQNFVTLIIIIKYNKIKKKTDFENRTKLE